MKIYDEDFQEDDSFTPAEWIAIGSSALMIILMFMGVL